MAEVSYIHLHEEDDLQDVIVPFPYSSHDFDPDPDFSPSLSAGPQTTSVHGLDQLSDLDSITTVCPFDSENRVNIIMGLLHQGVEQLSIGVDSGTYSRPSYADLNLDPNFSVIEGNDEMGSTHSDLGSGLCFGVDDFDNYNCQFTLTGIDDDFYVSRRESQSESSESSTLGGLRVVRVSSDSEGIENEVEEINLSREVDCGLDEYLCDEDPSLGLCWDSFELAENADGRFDFEWEEVDERERLTMFFDDEVDEDLDASVATLIPPRDEVGGERRNLEWEVLLNSPNFDMNVDIEHDGDEYNYTAEYETLIAQFTEAEHALVGRPPASKTVVDDLPVVVVDDNNALCAICKDEIEFGGQAKQLPCSHHYHGDCIVPWLGIRNTCPVCRYELPTDDPAYERRRTQRAGRI